MELSNEQEVRKNGHLLKICNIYVQSEHLHKWERIRKRSCGSRQDNNPNFTIKYS